MAYSTNNPPRLISQSVGDGGANASAADISAGYPDGGGSLWMYVDGDTVVAVKGASYFSDGADLGMKVGDMVLIADKTTPASGTAVVDTVNSDGSVELT